MDNQSVDIIIYDNEQQRQINQQKEFIQSVTSQLPAIQYYLVKQDPCLARLFTEVGKLDFSKLIKSPFPALVGVILGQKISYTRAKSLRSQLYDIVGGIEFTPIDILTNKDKLYKTYAEYRLQADLIISCAERFKDKTSNITADDIKSLKSISGIGDWTVDATLVTAMLADVIPLGDAFLKKRIAKLYNLNSNLISIEQIRQISSAWTPYRHIVTWYLWRWFD